MSLYETKDSRDTVTVVSGREESVSCPSPLYVLTEPFFETLQNPKINV